MEELIKKIKKISKLSGEAEAYLRSISKIKEIKKGEVLVREGEAVRSTYFVLSGCLRSYCIDKNGKEHTLQFAIKDWWMSDFIAMYGNEPATLTIECVTTCSLVVFSIEKLQGIFEMFPEFEPFQRTILQGNVVSLNKRILNQLQLTASERYSLFLQQYPDIEKNISNYHIASYLGVTQQSLSRIRAERVKK